jgi:hypothetical protein
LEVKKPQTVNDIKQELYENDTIIINKEILTLLQKCCECGNYHMLTFERKKGGDVHINFKNLNTQDIDLSEIDDLKKVNIIPGRKG